MITETINNENVKILIVDDEKELAGQISDSLELEGFKTRTLNNPLLIRSYIEDFDPSIILLDKLMPEKDGIDVLKEIRSDDFAKFTPIIMLTACAGKFDKIWAFKSGADDYICKPFDIDELIERVYAIKRRSAQSQKKVIGYNGLEIAIRGQFVSVGNTEVNLTVTEFNLLKELMKRKGEVLSRKEICLQVLGKEYTVERTVDVHIVSLRRKLKHVGEKIKTVRGVGYRLVS